MAEKDHGKEPWTYDFGVLRHFENIHIPLWLLKDTCWMMEWKTLGMVMIVPTVSVAFYLMLKTRGKEDFYINAAILCWICANGFWMVSEFFLENRYKMYSSLPFCAGFIFVSVYYLRMLYFYQKKRKSRSSP